MLASTALSLAAAVPQAAATDANWLANPGTGDFDTGSNWSTGAVPTGATAFFGASSTTALSFSAFTVTSLTFNAGASAYTFDTNGQFVHLVGAGIVINGGSAAITNTGTLRFFDASSAGSATITNNPGFGLGIEFRNSSTAGSAAITNNTFFFRFYDTSTAGSAFITNNGSLAFAGLSTAGSATITNNLSLSFEDTSTAGNAAIANNAGGTVNFSNSTGPAGDKKLSAGSIAGVGNYVLGAVQLTVGGNDLSTNVSGVISGAGGALVKTGAGTMTLSGHNTYSGGTTVNAGTLALTGAGTLGAATGVLAVNGGTLDLGGTSQTVGAMTLTGGTITNGTLTGTAFGVQAGTVSAVLAGGGALTKTGAGTTTLSGVNTYAGGTNLNGGVLSVGADANLGNLAGALTLDGGTLRITGTAFNATARTINLGSAGGGFDISAAANTFTIGQTVGGNGGLTKTGAGTLTITSNNSYTGGTTLSAGTLVLAGAGTLGAATGALAVDGGALDLGGTSQTTGALTLTGGTITNGTLTGAVFGGQAGTVSAVLAGGGVLTKTGAGTLTLSGNNTYSGGTTVNAGILALAGAGTLGATTGALTVNGATLDLGGTSQTVGAMTLTGGTITNGTLTGAAFGVQAGAISAVLAGGGMLTKTGAGTLTLSGNNTYTGATGVNAGGLIVNGSIAASSGLIVESGAFVGGTGTLSTAVVNNGGTLAPGNSIGTLTVNGNLTFNGGAIYAVEVSPTAADRINVVGGSATLTGATVQAIALPGSFRGQTYTILNATDGLGGTQFAGVTATGSFSPARNPHLTYDLNNVYLVLDPSSIVLPQGASGNQVNVAGGINRAVESGATPPSGFDVLLNMTAARLGNALDQVSGQPGTASTQASFNASGQFLTLLLDPLAGNPGSERGVSSFTEDEAQGYASAGGHHAKMSDAHAAVTPHDRQRVGLQDRWGVWASGYGGSSTVGGNAAIGSQATTSRVYGTAVGADYRLSPDTRLGFALGGAGFNFALSNGLGGGRADLLQAGLFVRHTMGVAYASAALAYGWQDVTTDRTVTVAGADMLRANFKANTFAARAEAGWRLAPWPGDAAFGVTPHAALQVTSFLLPGYAERAVSGSNQFALAYASETATNVRTELGARADKPFALRDGLLTLGGRLAWAHGSNTDRPVTASFQSLPGATFTVNGAQPAANSALVTAGAEMTWRNGPSLASSFEGEFSDNTRVYTGKATLRYAW